MSLSTGHGSSKSAKSFSCVRCFERKVKCDRESPCSNCAKTNYECVFRVPPAPRRRKKRTQEEIMKAKLDRYEQILKEKGINVHTDGIRAEDLPDLSPSDSRRESHDDDAGHQSPGSSVPAPTAGRKFVSGRLLMDQGKSRFIENGLWTSVSEELRRPSDALRESDSEDESTPAEADENPEYILGLTPSSPGVRDLHPLPEQVLQLWQIFLDNVNPLSKLVHPPTLQERITSILANDERIPRGIEALMFSIYTIAVTSISAEECEQLFGESRPTLLTRYRSATKRALSRAKFLGTSDLAVLIAFVLHLLAMRDVYDSRTLWTLTGVANRIAEGMGVHRDGTNLGLNPFETEMRRRLWWQITLLDFRTAELSGSGNVGNIGAWDTRLPSNVNDADMYPGMKEPPTPSQRQTEMIFCLARYELANYWKMKLITQNPEKDFRTIWQNFHSDSNIAEKDKYISELEQSLEQKYVRFCDPSVPVEFMAIIVARAATNSMRLMAHHPRRYEKDEDVPESERKFLWTTSMKLLETDYILHSSAPMRKFLWHTDHYFQWPCFIYILGELKRVPNHEQADIAWTKVHDTFASHPNYVTDTKKPIFYAVGNLVLKAWAARVQEHNKRGIAFPLREPEYLQILRKQREEVKEKMKDRNMLLQPSLNSSDNRNISASDNNLSQRQFMSNFQSTQLDSSMSSSSMPSQQQPPSMSSASPRQSQFMSTSNTGTPSTSTNTNYATNSTPNSSSNPNPFVQEMQQPQYFWWDYNNIASGNSEMDFSSMNMGVNNMNAQDMVSLGAFGGIPMSDVDAGGTMDWDQWEFLLKDVRPTG